MKILGLDPSLTNYGWAVHDTNATVGTPERCIARGRFQTPSKMEFVERYMAQRESLRAVIRQYEPDRVGIEFPVFNNLWSEGMYGLFLYSCEALKAEHMDVVFWSPGQVKAHARDSIVRPTGWKMDKPDMVEAAKADCCAHMNHNEADAYWSASFQDASGGFSRRRSPKGVVQDRASVLHQSTHLHPREEGRSHRAARSRPSGERPLLSMVLEGLRRHHAPHQESPRNEGPLRP